MEEFQKSLREFDWPPNVFSVVSELLPGDHEEVLMASEVVQEVLKEFHWPPKWLHFSFPCAWKMYNWLLNAFD